MKTTVYEIWLVDNGSLTEFSRGWRLKATATANHHWGDYDTLDEVRGRFRELAAENYFSENGPGIAADDAEAESASYIDKCEEALCIEWQDDLKWVRVREMSEDEDGNRTFVKVLP